MGKELDDGEYGALRMYEEFIAEYHQLLEGLEAHRVTKDVEAECFAWDSMEGQLLLKGDSVIELGGGNLPAVSGVLYYVGLELAENSAKRVTLYGPDLPMLKGDVPYARVSLVGVRKEFTTEEYKLYNLLRSIEYIRYHVNPRGYMPRISTVQGREQVRVSKDALDSGIDFYKAGRLYEEAYLKHPAVQSVETVFITLQDFDYRAMQKVFDRAESVTMSLDHPLNNLKMDCNSCNLKPVCDEVDALCGDLLLSDK